MIPKTIGMWFNIPQIAWAQIDEDSYKHCENVLIRSSVYAIKNNLMLKYSYYGLNSNLKNITDGYNFEEIDI